MRLNSVSKKRRSKDALCATKGVSPDESGKIPHHRGRLRSILQHQIGDAGVTLDKTVDAQARVHQALETLDDLPSPELDGTDFDGTIAVFR